jgi:hypothetical protein
MPAHCETCKWRDQEGYCLNEKLHEDWGAPDVEDHLVYDYTEGGGFWVGPKFGCVHWVKSTSRFGA